MRKLFVYIILVFGLFFLVGCQIEDNSVYTGGPVIETGTEYNSISLDDFRSYMEDKGFSVEEDTSSYDASLTNGVLKAANGNYEIIFFDLIDSDVARASYVFTKASINSSSGAARATSYFTDINMERSSLSSDGKYALVSRVNSTMIYVDCDASYKDEVVSICKDLGF